MSTAFRSTPPPPTIIHPTETLFAPSVQSSANTVSATQYVPNGATISPPPVANCAPVLRIGAERQRHKPTKARCVQASVHKNRTAHPLQEFAVLISAGCAYL